MATTRFIAKPGVQQVLIEREFDAPRDLVYRAHVEPDLLVQWLGPRGYDMTIEQFDVRNGGTWRFVHRGVDGMDFAFNGVFHGTPSPDGMVQTFEYEGWPGRVSLETRRFEERAGKTLVRQNVVYQSVEHRDAMIESSMEHGVTEGYERLDELLARIG